MPSPTPPCGHPEVVPSSRWHSLQGPARMHRSVARAVSLVVLLAAAAPGRAGSDLEFFEKRIRPLLAEHCHSCHGPKRQRGGLQLSSASGIREGGDRGPVVNAGKPDESLLLRAVRYVDDELRMPPKG